MNLSPSVQHAKNTSMMLQCEECDKWCLVFAKKKLPKRQKASLQYLFDSISYSCGLTFGMKVYSV